MLLSPKDSQKAISSNEQQLTPFNEEQKQSILLQLQNIHADLLKPALINAALSMYPFPFPLNSKIDPLQKSYKEHQQNEQVKLLLEQAIKTYFDTEGLEQFQKLYKAKFIEKDWPSGFLAALSSNLNISLQVESIVEIAIQQGKVYWRIVKGHAVLYDRPRQKGQTFDFEQSKKIRMTWQKFLEFKNSGKRSGTVAITQKRFTSFFPPEKQDGAAKIWSELKEKGILNKNDRLSDGWRVICNKEIKLDSLSQGPQHWDIVDALYTIANNKAFHETINNVDIPNAIIYRPERSLKKWGGKSAQASRCLIKNESPTNEVLCSKLWDVSIKKDLKYHRNTSTEEQLYKEILNYDHIPSGAILREENKLYLTRLSDIIANQEQSLKKLVDDIQSYQSKLMPDSSPIITRSQKQKNLNPEIQELEEKCLVEQKKLDLSLSVQQQLKSEKSDIWWSIAITATLHSSGKSYLKSLKEQQKSIIAPFFTEINYYLDLLETRWKEFLPSEDEYLKALGAFRYLYRCQVKGPSKINGNWEVGITPFWFFKNPQKCHDIDNLFHERLQRFLLKREGFSELENNKIIKNLLA